MIEISLSGIIILFLVAVIIGMLLGKSNGR
jgi:hypothetical protein